MPALAVGKATCYLPRSAQQWPPVNAPCRRSSTVRMDRANGPSISDVGNDFHHWKMAPRDAIFTKRCQVHRTSHRTFLRVEAVFQLGRVFLRCDRPSARVVGDTKKNHLVLNFYTCRSLFGFKAVGGHADGATRHVSAFHQHQRWQYRM